MITQLRCTIEIFFEVHRKYSKFLDKWLDDIQLLMKDKTNIRKGLLINTLETFNHTEITKLYKVVNKIRDGKEQKEKKRDTPV